MSLAPPEPDYIADFTVWWESPWYPYGQWIGKHHFSTKVISAPTLRDLEIQACAARIVHEWRQAGIGS